MSDGDELWNKITEDSDLYLEENQILSPLLDEINMIQDEHIKSFTRALLLAVDEFWEAPSSMSGVYHPPDERGSGGNVLHTKRVVRIVDLLAEAMERSTYETDMLLSAALLHDITKIVRWDKSTVGYDKMHPITVTVLFERVRQSELDAIEELASNTLELDAGTIEQILRLVRCHMGKWSVTPELIPITPFEMTLHWADMVAAHLHEVIDMDV
jgi:hypothetical protein